MIVTQLDLTKPLIQTVTKLLTTKECSEWIDKIKASGTDFAPINTKDGVKIDNDVRNNKRVIFDDFELANKLYNKIKDFAPKQIHDMRFVGVNERLRCYEYQPGQRFAPHSDGVFVRNESEKVFIPLWFI